MQTVPCQYPGCKANCRNAAGVCHQHTQKHMQNQRAKSAARYYARDTICQKRRNLKAKLMLLPEEEIEKPLAATQGAAPPVQQLLTMDEK